MPSRGRRMVMTVSLDERSRPVVPTGAERSEAERRDLFETTCGKTWREGPSTPLRSGRDDEGLSWCRMLLAPMARDVGAARDPDARLAGQPVEQAGEPQRAAGMA